MHIPYTLISISSFTYMCDNTKFCTWLGYGALKFNFLSRVIINKYTIEDVHKIQKENFIIVGKMLIV